ncbi:MAG: DUF2723 domain-containing protein, partial [bacterium]
HTLGIAHPTGYPLYTIIGRVFSFLPHGDVARRMVLFSVFCMTAACGLFLWSAANMARGHFGLRPTQASFFACAGVLPFAFSLTTWQTTTYAEVYPLTLFLVSVIFALGLHLLSKDLCSNRAWIAYGFVFGLALGNHLTVLWTFPLGVVAFLHCFELRREAPRALTAILLSAILGASIVLFLPIRSHLNPALDWGNPETPTLLWRHLSGWQYQVWMFQSGSIARLAGYFAGLPGEMGWGGLGLILLGAIGLAKHSPKVLVALALVWLVGILYNVNYDIPDIAPYFLPAHAALCLIAAAGAASLWQIVKPKTGMARTLLFAILAIPTLWNVAGHFGSANRSGDRFATSLAQEILRTLPPNALVFQSLWDVQSPAIYLQEVERVRTDAVLVDIHLMRRRWYVEQLFKQHPEIMEGCQKERDEFFRELAPFDAGKPFNPEKIERAFVALHDSLLSKNLPRRPVHIRFTHEAGHPRIGARFEARPASFFYRMGNGEPSDDLLDVEKIVGRRRKFDEREMYLLTKVYEILLQRQRDQQAVMRSERAKRQIELLTSLLQGK